MRSRRTAAGFVLALGLAPALDAQGPLYRERWTDLHLERLRLLVQHEAEGRDDAVLQRVADLLTEDGRGIPFVPAARALAHLRGVEPDPAFVLRATMGVFLLPEVVDPEATVEDCHRLNVTPVLPYELPLPGAITFAIEVVDAAGAVVHAARDEEAVENHDLRMGHRTLTVPGAELGDGTYRLRLRTLIDGAEPRDGDPVLEHRFHVLRGYQQRALAARDGVAAAVAAGMEPTMEAVLRGMDLEILRAYTGEAFDGFSDAVGDLRRAERALQNLAEDAPLLRGFDGELPAALPTGGSELLGATWRWPSAAKGTEPRPLVVVIGAAPSLDVAARRPSAPATRSSRWTRLRLGDFGLGGAWPIAWLQSPGGGMQFAKALPQALAALHRILPTDGRTVFVLELDAAIALSYAPDVLGEASAAVFVGAGVLLAPSLAKLGPLHVLGVPLTGHASSKSLQFTSKLIAERGAELGFAGTFQLARDLPRPWTFGAAAARSEIAVFLRQQ
ncbi:MAG: hypothetical protein AB7O97_00885 [Planctomycetota bacterium]